MRIHRLSIYISKESEVMILFKTEGLEDKKMPVEYQGTAVRTPSYSPVNNSYQPETLEYLDDYLLKLAGSYGKREEEEKVKEERPVVESFMKKFIENNEFCMQVPGDDNIIQSIMSEHFKNQFETGSSMGGYNLEGRRNVASAIFGIPKNKVNDILGEKFEKYGYLGNREHVLGSESFYGEVKFVFDKNALKDRTTMTVGDSGYTDSEVIASRVTSPKIESIPGVHDHRYQMLDDLYRLIRNRKITPDMGVKDVIRIAKDEAGQGIQYFELQYHGLLTKDDIEECYLPGDPSYDGLKSIISENGIVVHSENIGNSANSENKVINDDLSDLI